MTHSILLTDLIAWSAQAACLAAVGGLLPGLLRLDAPGVRYAYFRALLAVCLALPWLQSRQAMAGGTSTTEVFTAVLIGVPTAAETGHVVVTGFRGSRRSLSSSFSVSARVVHGLRSGSRASRDSEPQARYSPGVKGMMTRSVRSALTRRFAVSPAFVSRSRSA
jgi:hypothetical protein